MGLITELVNLHLEYADPTPTSYIQEDILNTFDHHFSYVAATAQLAGVKEKVIQKIQKAWREKISTAILNDETSKHCRQDENGRWH